MAKGTNFIRFFKRVDKEKEIVSEHCQLSNVSTPGSEMLIDKEWK